jgi:alpha-tubulin suppressor-like RCC1 family protein
LWTWGAGESGQLGTGGCTYRDVPEICIKRDTFGELFVSAACGYGHVIANSESGKLYSWGLNAKGQLGMGDITARKYPELVPGASDVTKVYANGHSSAYINSSGELFTWGSGLHYRLMNGDCSSNVLLPTKVISLSGNIIEKFLFAKTKSLVLVMTKAMKVNIIPSFIFYYYYLMIFIFLLI